MKEIPGKLVILFRKLQNYFNRKIVCLHSDNGTEFKNQVIYDFMKKFGIKPEYSHPRLPQQNGVAERSNRIILDGARTLLQASKLTISFWFYAVKYKLFIANRSLVNRKGKLFIPYTVLFGRKPDVRNLQIFGAKGLARRKPKFITKFASRASECIFLGFSEDAASFPFRFTIIPNSFISS